jgi:hypothetical protein
MPLRQDKFGDKIASPSNWRVHAPRRLPGLEETIEFEEFDATPPFDNNGEVAWKVEGQPTDDRERRWLELYAKNHIQPELSGLRVCRAPLTRENFRAGKAHQSPCSQAAIFLCDCGNPHASRQPARLAPVSANQTYGRLCRQRGGFRYHFR